MSAEPAIDPYGDDAACFQLTREQRPVEVIARFTVPGEPTSKARARFTRTANGVRTYTPKKTYDSEQRVAWAFRQAAPGHSDDGTSTYGIMGLFFAGTRQRRDVDNMLKLVCDGLNGVAWKDDVQVEEVAGRRGHDHPTNARTEVLIYRLGRRDGGDAAACEVCGGKYVTYPSWDGKRRYCSPECRKKAVITARAARVVVSTCENCGATIEGKAKRKFCGNECAKSGRRSQVKCEQCAADFTLQRCHVRERNYCSTECHTAWLRARENKRPRGKCSDCGAGVSKPTTVRCAACRRAEQATRGRARLIAIEEAGQ